MAKILIIGAGGVSNVVTKKCARLPIFTEIVLASRTKSKCDAIAAEIGGDRIKTEQVDADYAENVIKIIEKYGAFSGASAKGKTTSCGKVARST